MSLEVQTKRILSESVSSKSNLLPLVSKSFTPSLSVSKSEVALNFVSENSHNQLHEKLSCSISF
jgi:hypothetical protein